MSARRYTATVFFHRKSSGSWQHDTVDLSDDPGGSVCYEEVDNEAFGQDTAEPEHLYPRIQVPGGVAIQSHAVYVATSGGRFWMYGTLQGENASVSPNSFHLAGPTQGWPRYRKNLIGSARAY